MKGFVSVVFPFSEKHNCKQKFVNKNLYSHTTTNSFIDEVVKKQRNIYKSFKFVSVVKNLYFIISNAQTADVSVWEQCGCRSLCAIVCKNMCVIVTNQTFGSAELLLSK